MTQQYPPDTPRVTGLEPADTERLKTAAIRTLLDDLRQRLGS